MFEVLDRRSERYMRGTAHPASLRQTTAASVLAAGMFLLSACTGSAEGKEARESTSPSPSPSPTVTASVTAPANGADDVLTSTEVEVTTDGAVEAVVAKDTDGDTVRADLHPDGGSWIFRKQLDYATKYTLTATATRDGATKRVTSRFTTMSRPGSINGASPYIFDGDTVGVGMPIVVELTTSIPKAKRAQLERRFFVEATPAVQGSWYWWSDREVHYRPKDHWKPGTKVHFRLAIGGMDMGYGAYGKRDRVARFTVGDHVITKVDAAAHTARVYRNGTLLRTMPVSTGKASMPSSSGTHVVMDKKPEMTFDSGTFGVPATSADGYRQKVQWDVRYTWRGEFFHSAPWSVGDQGRRNVSHGCVNLGPANAKWFYDLATKGDLVEIVNTGRTVQAANGWTDWNVPWSRYVKGSALYKG
jgi:lipoprotein-anchoring transpeptidase ErfK/SrfK